MILFEDIPYASERMGVIWTMGVIENACILEFGPEGSTHYAAAQHGTYNGKLKASFFTTGLTEREVVFGETDVLEKGVRELVESFHPSHLFVVPSTVSETIGADMESICRDMSRKWDTQVICIGDMSFDSDFTVGAERCLSLLAKHVVREPAKREEKTYNVIGSVMDCYNYQSDLKEIVRMMDRAFGFASKAIFTSESSMESLSSAGEAAFNIVIRKEGLPCAGILKDCFGQPFYYGAPYGEKGTIKWIENVGEMIGAPPPVKFIEDETRKILEMKDRWDYYRRITKSDDISVIICGNHDLLKYCGPFIRDELQFRVKGKILNHSVKGEPSEDFMFFRDDATKYARISEESPDFLLADAVTLRRFKGKIPGLQVSNPNLGGMRLYDDTPFMGFRGVRVLIQEAANMLVKSI